MTSFMGDVADDVAAMLAAETWSESVNPESEWVLFEDMSEDNLVGKLRVACVPVSYTTEMATRESEFETATVDVVVQEKPQTFTKKRMGELARLTEDVMRFLAKKPGRKLPNVDAQMSEMPTLPFGTLIKQEHLVQYREFASVIRTTWQRLR